MSLILWAIGIFCLSGLVSLLAWSNRRWSNILGASGAVLGCLTGLVPAVNALYTGRIEEVRCAWSVPFGAFIVRIDALSAFFLMPVFTLCALCAVYGMRYMASYDDRKRLGSFWLFYNILAASMVMTLVAANGVLFLIAWEVMALSSFFLVTFEDEKENVRRAGLTYLISTHLGTAFLLALFLLLGRQAGGAALDFDKFLAMRGQMAPIADIAFLLAVVGFGAKAGFIPFHVWLPEAHPAAPSHVSAVMSGVMIKTGVYGLLRTLTFLGAPESWWGWLLIGIGLTSGILGVLFALAQHDLKRLLAYHSVENIGIIALGLGLGVLGAAANAPALAVLGFGGGLLHVVNHALFKGLLFLGAGSVLHGTGTGEIDLLGGLIKRMPWTAGTFLCAAVAISGLPPLNGFISEFMIYVGALLAVGEPTPAVAGIAVIIGLALIGGLAAACFTKAFGIVFLGEPRSAHAVKGHEAAWGMLIPMLLLAAGCALIGLLAPTAVDLTHHAVAVVAGLPAPAVRERLAVAMAPMHKIVLAAATFVLLIGVLAWARRKMLSGRTVGQSCTWDCGYARPAASMQYTASSFAQPLTKMFEVFLRPVVKWEKPVEIFPDYASFHTKTEDVFTRNLYGPIFHGVERLASMLRFLQGGRVQFYVLYIAVTVLVLLVLNLR